MLSTTKIIPTIILSLLMVAPSTMWANSPIDQELHTQADELYQKGSFAQANDLYQRITQKTPSVYFNIGNCAYNMEKFGLALLSWRRAELDWGLVNRGMLLKNIDLVKQKTATKYQQEANDEHYPKVLINTFTTIKLSFFSLIKSVPIFYLQILVLALWLVLFAYLRSLRKRKQKMLTCLLFGLLALSASMLALKYSLQHKQQLVVLYNQAPLHSGPGKNFAVIGHLPEAQEADILKKSGGFYRIRINKHTGWIEKQAVEKI